MSPHFRLSRRSRLGLAIAVALFVTAEITLGVLLQISPGHLFAPFAFGAILLACLFCALWMEPSRPYLLTQAALLCTVCADYFLVWRDPQIKLPAMIFFLMVQLLYAARLWDSEDRPSHRRWHIPTRLLLSAAVFAVTLAVLRQNTDALALVSMLYYASLILNILLAFLQFRKQALLALGLVLFLCCDTLIGLDMLDSYLTVPSDSLIHAITHPGFNLAWAFYLPSQVLIAISLLPIHWKHASRP
ncbi:MAG: hypothetical protein IJX62_04535 [Clostridia bacterium]|nr:hypothetical protein [Clostridia bacterium]